MISRIKIIKNIIDFFINQRPSFIESKGITKLKNKTLNDYDFSLAIEPYLGKPRMILEKIFDPMLAGSIPIYYGPDLTDIPSNCYLRIDSHKTAKDIISIIKKLSSEEKNNYRQNIYNFLISEKAEKYRYEFYAKSITDHIKN